MADPKDTILELRQQGIPNNQIVQQLQQQGYKSHEIFDAMNQMDIQPADAMGAAGDDPPPPMRSPPQAPMPPPIQAPVNSLDDQTEKIEEIAESIIEEKWTELISNVNKIIDWKDKTESRLTKIETNFENIKNNFDKLHTGILGKISEYEHGMTDLGTEIKALEKVFQKILPTLTENVNELSRITKSMK
jgi:DNA-binding transcriptional MerR regulator